MAEDKKPEEQSQPLLLHTDSAINNNNSAMSQLRDSLLSQLTQLNPSLTPSTITDRSSFIQSRLQELFHSFRTPTHPPYALMINKAITELKGKIGSTEEAISEFVKREYEDLPWAHGKILSLHLKRLCETGEIVCNENGRYVFPVGCVEEKVRRKCGRKRKRGGNRRSNRGGDVERGMDLVSVGSDETSMRVCESDHRSIGNVEGQKQEVQMVKSLSPADGEEEKERGKGSRKRKRGNTRSSCGDGESGNQLCLLDSAGTDEPSTQISESDRSIGSVEEHTQIQPEEGIVEHNELEETQIQMVSSEICAEESPECISTGPGIESSSPTQVPHQISTDIDTGITTALVCVNGDDDEHPQDYNEGNTNGNSDENPMSDSDSLEEMQPKRKRGRPRKSESDSNCQEKPLLLKQGATRNKKKEQNGQTRGRGRPRKVNQDTEQCEEELKESEERKKEEKSRKKEEKLKKKEEKDQAKLCGGEKKLKIKDQAKLRGRGQGHGRGRGQGRPKVCDAIAEAPAYEDQAKLHGRGRGRGRGRG